MSLVKRWVFFLRPCFVIWAWCCFSSFKVLHSLSELVSGGFLVIGLFGLWIVRVVVRSEAAISQLSVS